MLVKQEKERRKVQISGKSSCMVALPKKWVREMGLEQGSEVTITKLNSRSLLVNAQPDSTQGGGREAFIEVSSDDPAETIFRKIVSLYVLGFSRIIIEGSGGYLGSSKKLALKDLVRRHLIGTEGVAESRDRMTVHVLLGYSELSVESALKKMLLIIDSLRNDAVQALEKGDAALAEAASDRQDEVGRFGLYVIRQLNLSLSRGVLPDLRLENRDTLGYILVARILERIAYHASGLTKAAGGLARPLTKPMVQKLTSMNETACGLVDEALLSLFKRDHEGADAVVEKSRVFVEKETGVIRSLSESDSQTYYTLHVLMDSQRRIAEYAKDVAEIVLDMTVERTLREQEPVAPQISYA
jgi:phosphate uptake regulator